MPCLLVFVAILALSIVPALAADPDADDLREWRSWAVAALDAPPSDIRPWPALADRLREIVDERRNQNDLPPLSVAGGLLRAADAHAIDMLRRDFMAHESDDGIGVDDRVALLARRFVGVAGENIAEHTGLTFDDLEPQAGPLALKIAGGWMNSPGHRENILRPDYSHAAIGAFIRGDRLVVVHVFGSLRSLLADAITFEQMQGDRLPLDIASESPSTPSHYGFRPPDQSVENLVVLELTSSEIVVDPGLFQLMFLFSREQEGRFTVADGPWIDVR